MRKNSSCIDRCQSDHPDRSRLCWIPGTGAVYADERARGSCGSLHVSGDETAILYNYEQQEQTGIYENGQTYLPVSWINDHINERVLLGQHGKSSYTRLPDQIVYADAETKGSNGAPLLVVKDDEVYLTLGLIANYTDVQIRPLIQGMENES